MKQVNIEDTWFDVPDRAKWLAQDLRGKWFWYEEEPYRCGEWYWYRGEPHLYAEYWDSNTSLGYITRTASPKDFTEELYELVDEDDVRHTCSEHFVCLHELSAHCPPAGLSCFCPKCTPK